ncbi:zinc finger CCCH domain-containing protein 12 isoform X2 [Durio zibethinus]|uniref:Zinc finger CCCH domain-containing protein 12 isoform X2 n=1 Tax=Durio zibethinus TaxID=66656 RepID=A0A6P5WQC0_DURZI|nr:zinc finger CCCH domain-containing protein 12 isoform X2 [Durio zibethinus]
MDYSRENVVHVIPTNGPDNWVPNSTDPSVWATEEDYRVWNNQETSSDTPSNSSYDQRHPQSRSNSEQPPNKKSRNSQELNSRSKAIGKMFFKTKLCCKFRAGTCPYITNCNFAHSIEELRRPPPNWQEIVAAHEEEKGILSEPREEYQIPSLGSSSFTGETQRSYKGRHCKKFYTEEGCPYGDSCTFLHDEQSKNRESVAISLGPGGYGGGAGGGGGGGGGGSGGGGGGNGNGSNAKPSNWKTRICNKWELTGYCPFGNKCHFAHGVAASFTWGVVFVSFAFVFGVIRMNIYCYYRITPIWRGPCGCRN